MNDNPDTISNLIDFVGWTGAIVSALVLMERLTGDDGPWKSSGNEKPQ